MARKVLPILTEEEVNEFLKFVVPSPNNCMVWTGNLYGSTDKLKRPYYVHKNVKYSAARLLYQISSCAELSPVMVLRRKPCCKTERCVNPDHFTLQEWRVGNSIKNKQRYYSYKAKREHYHHDFSNLGTQSSMYLPDTDIDDSMDLNEYENCFCKDRHGMSDHLMDNFIIHAIESCYG